MSILEHSKKINIWALGAGIAVLGLSLAFGSLKLWAFEGQGGTGGTVRIDSSRIETNELVEPTKPAKKTIKTDKTATKTTKSSEGSSKSTKKPVSKSPKP